MPPIRLLRGEHTEGAMRAREEFVTDYEIADLAASVMSNYLTTVSLFISIVSAYLITAFLAGEKLNRVQVSIVNACFLVFTSWLGPLSVRILMRAFDLSSQSVAHEFNDRISGTREAFAVGLLYALLVVGSLLFMRSVRSKISSEDAPE
jgi:hypothetical protein